ncbi:MAG: carboxylating nicotinate-nucleotide diphosphorylase [Verrucomicrobiota bacterium]
MNEISRTLIRLALAEDLDEEGDLTSLYFVDPEHRSTGEIVSREFARVSGHEVAAAVCGEVDAGLRYKVLVPDGEIAGKGTVISTLEGPTRSLLTAERTLLNFLQRLSGVATITHRLSEMITHTKARLLDTRKTTPGFRELEKKAVVDGGGSNHRIGLFDAVMVKDNHLAANPSPLDLAERVAGLKKERPELKIEVEADRLDQLASFLKIPGIDVVLLDNMSIQELSEAVGMREKAGSPLLLEASGGVDESTIVGIAESGVDFISVGALTHSVRAIDFGLDLQSDVP